MQYLRPREHYETLYDEGTVERCRSGERVVNGTFAELEKKVPKQELEGHLSGYYLYYSRMYFQLVETVAAIRSHERDKTIAEWMERDDQKDRRLADAQLAKTPYCRACGKDMQLLSKDYMHRDSSPSPEREYILFMFECTHCNKRTAFWEDGTEWEGHKVYCEKCNGEMVSSHTKSKGVITMVYTCTKCGHNYDYVLDMGKDEPADEESADPFFELDHKRFCFDSDMIFKYKQKTEHLMRLASLHLDAADRMENVDVYDAVKDIKQLKIAQLGETLTPVIAKDGYSKFKLEQPQIGREVAVGFSCLDSKPHREEHQSKKSLGKLISNTLKDTNWRLMSEGVSYRLGYLNGRLRAYESEEDMKKLVEQRLKDGTLNPPKKEPVQPLAQSMPKFEGMQMREAALVYMSDMTLGSRPAEITLKSGKKKQTGVPVLNAEMNPLLRVIIPMRDNDDSAPEFIRAFDFKMGRKDDEIPKVTKDSQGREIRLL